LARNSLSGVPVIGIGTRWSSFNLPAARVDGMTGILVEPQDRAAPIGDPGWSAVVKIGKVARETGGIIIETYRLYRVVARRAARGVLLPRPAIN
jgi:hypothetical protein